MTGVLKTILIVLVVVIGFGILLAIQANSPGGAIGIPGVIILFAGWAAIKAIRSYESEDNKDTTDIHKLDKD